MFNLPEYSPQIKTYRSTNLGTGAASVAVGQSQLLGFVAHNTGAASQFIKFYDYSGVATAWSTPVKLTFPIEAGTTKQIEFNYGASFSSGIGVAGTTLLVDTASGAPPSNSLIINVLYI